MLGDGGSSLLNPHEEDDGTGLMPYSDWNFAPPATAAAATATGGRNRETMLAQAHALEDGGGSALLPYDPDDAREDQPEAEQWSGNWRGAKGAGRRRDNQTDTVVVEGGGTKEEKHETAAAEQKVTTTTPGTAASPDAMTTGGADDETWDDPGRVREQVSLELSREAFPGATTAGVGVGTNGQSWIDLSSSSSSSVLSSLTQQQQQQQQQQQPLRNPLLAWLEDVPPELVFGAMGGPRLERHANPDGGSSVHTRGTTTLRAGSALPLKDVDLSAWSVRDRILLGIASYVNDLRRASSVLPAPDMSASLVSLDLSNSTRVTDVGVRAILTCGFHTLQHVNLSGCWRVTERAFENVGNLLEGSPDKRSGGNQGSSRKRRHPRGVDPSGSVVSSSESYVGGRDRDWHASVGSLHTEQQPSTALSSNDGSRVFPNRRARDGQHHHDQLPPPQQQQQQRCALLSLDLSHLPHLDDLFARTLASPACLFTRRIRRLAFRHCPALSDTGVGCLAKIKTLESLDVSGCGGLRGRTFRQLLEGCILLKELVCNGCPRLSDDSLRSIAARKASFGYSRGAQRPLPMRILGLGGAKRLTDGSLQWVVGKLWRLYDLDLSGVRLLSDKTVNMCGRACPRLRSLTLSGCKRITDEALVFLGQTLVQHNRHRPPDETGGESASRTAFSAPVKYGDGKYDHEDRAAAETAAKAEASIFRDEDDDGDGGGDHAEGGAAANESSVATKFGVSALVMPADEFFTAGRMRRSRRALQMHVPQPVGLTALNLSGCVRVSDRGVKALADVSHHLRQIDVRGCPRVTDVALAALATHCTQLEDLAFGTVHHHIAKPRAATPAPVPVTDEAVMALCKQVRQCTLQGRSIAIGKHVRQSTTLAGRGAHNAVDGNVNGYYGLSYDDPNGKVSHTCQQPNPWLIVDLGTIVDIGFVRVWGAAESERFAQNFPLWIMVSELPFDETVKAHAVETCSRPPQHLKEGSTDAPEMAPSAVDCEPLYGVKVRFGEERTNRHVMHRFDRPARYVRVQCEGAGPLILGEVQVYAKGALSLTLTGCALLTDVAANAVSRYFVHLTSLNVSGCVRLGPDGVSAVLKALVRLRDLHLAGCRSGVTDLSLLNGLSAGRNAARPKIELRSLSVAGCHRLTDTGLTTIAAACPNLAELRCEGLPRLSSRGVANVARLCPALERFYLSTPGPAFDDGNNEVPPLSRDALQPLLTSLRLGTFFDRNGVCGIEPRSDVETIRLVLKLTQQRQQMRLAAECVQRRYRQLRSEHYQRQQNYQPPPRHTSGDGLPAFSASVSGSERISMLAAGVHGLEGGSALTQPAEEDTSTQLPSAAYDAEQPQQPKQSPPPSLEALLASMGGGNDDGGRDTASANTAASVSSPRQSQEDWASSSRPYTNQAMFEVARAEGHAKRERIRRVMELVGRPPRARKIQRCWREYHAHKVAELKEMLRGRRMTRAVRFVVKMQALLRGLRVRRAARERKRKKRVDKVLKDMKRGKVSLSTKGLKPAIRREIAAILIQRNARIKVARLRVRQIEFDIAYESGCLYIVERAIMRKVARIRGRKMLEQIRADFRVASAVRIQNAWRISQARRGMLDMRNARQAMLSAIAAKQQRLLMGKRGMAARRIQKQAWKYMHAQRLRRQARAHVEREAALVIRRSWVRSKAKRAQIRMKVLLRFELRRKQIGSKAIQAWWRRRVEIWRARLGIRLLILRHEGAAIIVQRWLRQYVRPLVLARLGVFARRIQGMYRSHVFRRKTEKMLRRKRLQYQFELEAWEEWREMERMVRSLLLVLFVSVFLRVFCSHSAPPPTFNLYRRCGSSKVGGHGTRGACCGRCDRSGSGCSRTRYSLTA